MVDSHEAIRYLRTQLNRCRINLHAAKDRRDERAVNNIQHKIEVYEYVIKELSSR